MDPNGAAGHRGSARVTVTNDGNIASAGGDLTLSLSASGSGVADFPLVAEHMVPAIRPGRSRRFLLRFEIPPAAAPGTYSLSALVTLIGTGASATSALPLTVT